jgi:hypothetical protein
MVRVLYSKIEACNFVPNNSEVEKYSSLLEYYAVSIGN